jgi:hypothetical protein
METIERASDQLTSTFSTQQPKDTEIDEVLAGVHACRCSLYPFAHYRIFRILTDFCVPEIRFKARKVRVILSTGQSTGD